MNTAHLDVAIIGGGIIGLSTTIALSEHNPRWRIVVLEKEREVGSHQTGHNSGVIHSGIYYRPGSMKAKMCVEGSRALMAFCEEHGIPYTKCGKVVVATSEAELAGLKKLYEHGQTNGVAGLELIGVERLREIEPYASGLQALWVPSTAVVDFARIAKAFAAKIQNRNGAIRTSAMVKSIRRREGSWILETTAGEFRSKYLVTCAGLFTDRLASRAGGKSRVHIVPFRGEYHELAASRRSLVRGLIYPVPNPKVPFLGVHFTRTIHGQVHAGPNAVLAFKREGYKRTDLSLCDVTGMFAALPFWRMVGRYWNIGFAEMYRSVNKGAFVRALQRLIPAIQAKDLSPNGAGVRAQAIDAAGRLLDDFAIEQASNAVHVRNVASPAASASLSIGKAIARMAEHSFV